MTAAAKQRLVASLARSIARRWPAELSDVIDVLRDLALVLEQANQATDEAERRAAVLQEVQP